MGEEEIMQCENCTDEKCSKDNCLIGYDICALIFCVFPLLTSIFGIDYHNANNIVQSAFRMLVYSVFPLAITIISLKKSDKFKTISSAVFSFLFVLMLVYGVLLLIGFVDGGKLF